MRKIKINKTKIKIRYPIPGPNKVTIDKSKYCRTQKHKNENIQRIYS